jgi:hypothetical protein
MAGENLLFVYEFVRAFVLLTESFENGRSPMMLCSTFGTAFAQPNEVCPLSNGRFTVSVRFRHSSLPGLTLRHHLSANDYFTDISWIVVNSLAGSTGSHDRRDGICQSAG